MQNPAPPFESAHNCSRPILVVISLAIAVALMGIIYPSQAIAQTTLTGNSGSYVYPPTGCTYSSPSNPDYNGSWYQPAIYGTPVNYQLYCGITFFIYQAPSNYSGPIAFTISKASAQWFTNVNGAGLIGAWYPIDNQPGTGLCPYYPNNTAGTFSKSNSSGPGLNDASGGGWFTNNTATFNVAAGAEYCIGLGLANTNQAFQNEASSSSYTISWVPGAPPAPTDGPIPPWAVGLLGFSMLVIARRQISRHQVRSRVL